jgi:hypothetical protein
MDESKPIKVAGIEIPAEERTPLVDCLLRVIQQQGAEIRGLRDEIARLKGLPPRPTIRASTLNAPHPDPSHKKKLRGKRPGSAKRQKTGKLTIHETIPVPLEELPAGTQQNGYEDFVVQDLKIEAHNVCYRRLRYLLPDGTSRTAPLPTHIRVAKSQPRTAVLGRQSAVCHLQGRVDKESKGRTTIHSAGLGTRTLGPHRYQGPASTGLFNA